jgi:DNA-binding NarL/FixJ family response regulator
MISLALAIIDSSIYDNNDFPEWFRVGNFELLPADSHPAAKVFYIKYLYMAAFDLASRQVQVEGVSGLALMKLIPNTIEPLISQAVVDKTVIPEIYLRMSCAVAYHNTGQKERALAHIDRAIALALRDKLYGILTEYVRHFDGLLEERIALVDAEAAAAVSDLYSVYRIGWSRLSGKIRHKDIATNLTPKEHEVAKLCAFGFSVKEIAGMLYVSESTIKQTIARVINKTGIQDKSEFPYIL